MSELLRLLAAGVLVIQAQAELTWYNPALCHELPVNCFDARHWWRMAAGHDARQWYERAAACPGEFPLYTRVLIDVAGTRHGLPTDEWVCLDRGGSIIIEPDGTLRLDLLLEYPIWRDTVDVTLLLPRPDRARRR